MNQRGLDLAIASSFTFSVQNPIEMAFRWRDINLLQEYSEEIKNLFRVKRRVCPPLGDNL